MTLIHDGREFILHPLFQSSPTPEGGCDYATGIYGEEDGEFQSSPTPEGGCDALAISRPNCAQDLLFQSSPTPEGGCDVDSSLPISPCSRSFQSSPTPEGGCDLLPAPGLIDSCLSFNPHPPRKVGVTCAVFVLARPK